jgi:hypothetical protein
MMDRATGIWMMTARRKNRSGRNRARTRTTLRVRMRSCGKVSYPIVLVIYNGTQLTTSSQAEAPKAPRQTAQSCRDQGRAESQAEGSHVGLCSSSQTCRLYRSIPTSSFRCPRGRLYGVPPLFGDSHNGRNSSQAAIIPRLSFFIGPHWTQLGRLLFRFSQAVWPRVRRRGPTASQSCIQQEAKGVGGDCGA